MHMLCVKVERAGPKSRGGVVTHMPGTYCAWSWAAAAAANNCTPHEDLCFPSLTSASPEAHSGSEREARDPQIPWSSPGLYGAL